ncbi:hypothetical protein L596_028998 [Steinernema carpocapsae]|uniref:CAF17 C-terminal domain-containing protein n=1 Tax=Steinernema carpocapsae TaxID=34508 RepID=A0A4U5LTC0_STECR|nr:hypothetical protein L596_028998 [Steinernema carpocapsae]
MLKNVFRLNSRRLLRLSGPDTENFLQGIISKDIRTCEPNNAVYSFLFSNKGRIQHDLFIYKEPSCSFLIECDAESIPKLKKTFLFYRLRKKVQIDEIDDKIYFSTPSIDSPSKSLLTVEDPRVPGFGFRSIVPAEADLVPSHEDGYLKRRLEWGLAEGSSECGDQLPFNMNGDLVNAVSLDKGCYVGQELTARTFHTGIIRRRVLPFKANENVPEEGPKEILDTEGVRRGKVIATHENLGLALCSLDNVDSKLFIDNAEIKLSVPSWWPQNRR